MSIINGIDQKNSTTHLKLLDNSKQSLINNSFFNSSKNILELHQQIAARKNFFKKYSLNDNEISSKSRRLKKTRNTVKFNQKETDYTVCFKNPTLIKKKSTTHSHKKARAFNDTKEGEGYLYLAEAIKESESRTLEGEYKNRLAMLSISIAIIAALGIIIGIIDCEINITQSNKVLQKKDNKDHYRDEEFYLVLQERKLTFVENLLFFLYLCVYNLIF